MSEPDTPEDKPSSSPAAPEQANEELRGQLERPQEKVNQRKRTRRRRIRGILAGFLVVLTSISIVATTVSVWTNRTVFDTGRYVALVAPLADDPKVTDPLAAKITDQMFQSLNVEQRLTNALSSIQVLPDQVALLAGPITSAAQTFIEGQVRQYLRSDAFKNLWVRINQTAHAKIVALLEGNYQELPHVSVQGGVVQLNMISVIAQVLRNIAQRGLNLVGVNATIPDIPPNLDASAARQRLSSALGVTLPADFGQITIMTQDQLSALQKAVHRLKQLVILLVLLSVVLLAAAIVVAPNRRRIVIWLGVGTAAAMFVAAIAIRRIQASILDRIKAAGAQQAAKDVFHQVANSLRGLGLWVFWLAVIAAVIAYLLGRPRWLMATIRWVRGLTARGPKGSVLEIWIAGHGDALRIGGIVAAVLILWLTGIGWISVLIVGPLLGLYLWGLWAINRRVLALPASMEGGSDR